MDDRAGVSIWPYFCVVVVLLAATVAAPRGWRSIAVAPWRRAASPSPYEPAADQPTSVASTVLSMGPLEVGAATIPFSLPPARQTLRSVAPDAAVELSRDSVRAEASSSGRPAHSLLPAAPVSMTRATTVRVDPPAVESDPPPRGEPSDNSLLAGPSTWPRPAALEARLSELEAPSSVRSLAQQARDQLAKLRQSPSLHCAEARTVLSALRSLGEQLRREAEQADRPEARRALLRAGYALERRVDVWEQVGKVVAEGQPASDGLSDGRAVAAALAKAAPLLGDGPSAEDWRKFLELEQLEQLAGRGAGPASARRRAARTVLRRIQSPTLSKEQREFLERPPLTQLAAALRDWAAGPVDCRALLRELEQYETAPSESTARRLAERCQVLGWSPRVVERELASCLETHYRNANVRVAVSEDLINRMLPALDEVEEPVLESILGARVSGQSKTAAQLKVTLTPDPSRWRVGLVARGEVASNTASSKGPVTFYSEGLSRFQAVKEVVLDGRGVRSQRTEADADADTTLTGLSTDFDGVPLLGLLVRTLALQQHDNRLLDAQWEAEGKLESRVSDRLDAEVRERLGEATQTLRAKLLDPIENLHLAPRVLDMETTPRRLIARCRLAGDRQLAAHTPRPQAPSDSLLSVQVHETLFNNALQQLGLAGKRIDLRDLYREIAAALGRPDVQVPDDYPDNVTVQFAKEAPVRLRCGEGRATLTLRLAELKHGRFSRWRNFEVRARYRPVVNELETRLERDGIVELGGQRLHLRDQIALRGIFSKVFSRRRPITVIGKELAESPQLAGLQLTQFTLDQGWVGVAIGPSRSGRERWASVRLHVSDETLELSDEREAR